jgi:hypothetical protein
MRFLLTIAVVLAAAAGLAAHAPGRAAPQPARLELIALLKHPVTVTSAPVTGLYPGSSKTLTVRVKSNYSWKIKIPKLTAKVSAATSRTGCAGGPANLVLSTSGRAITINPRKTGTIRLTVTMPRTVADACQGATFRISLTARAIKG